LLFATRIASFSNQEFWSKKLNWGGEKDPRHFGQINFNMFGVVGVVFLIGKVRII
jgi:hypothetical protein